MKKILFILTICMLCVIPAASADVDFTVTVNNDAQPQEITVTGTGAGAYKLVNLQIMEFGVDKSELDGAGGDVRGKVLYFGDTLSAVDGSFSFPVFKQVSAGEGNNGTYTAWVAVEDGDMYFKDYTFYSVTDIKGFVEKASQKTDKTELAKLIDDEGYLLDFKTRFDTFSGSSKTHLAEILLNQPKTIYVSTTAFQTAFNAAFAMQKFDDATTAAEVQAALNAYPDYIDLSKSAAYEVFNKVNWVSAAKRTDIYNALGVKNDFLSEREILDFFADKTVITALTGAGNVSGVDAIIAGTANIIGVDYAALSSNSIKWRNKLTALKPADYASLTTLKTALEKEVNPDNAPIGPGSVGGGGSGGVALKADAGVLTPNIDVLEPPETNAQPSFNDVGNYAWAADAINSLYEKGIISGRGNGEYAPADSVTREEFTKIMVGALGLEDGSASADFNDLPSSHWSYKYVAGAIKAGLINGLGDGSFGLGRSITRQETAVLIYRIAVNNGLEMSAAEPPFEDFYTVDGWAAQAISGAYSVGLIQGSGKNFNPHGTLTRAEAAVVVYRLLGELGK